MQSLKKKLLTILSLSLFIVLAGNYNVLAKMEENGENSNNACEVLTSEEPMLNKEYVNENGETVQHFEDNTQVVYHEDGTKTEYSVDGLYHPGRIPRCEPSNSLPCNSGYWEYRVY